jgi:hypothetical protein
VVFSRLVKISAIKDGGRAFIILSYYSELSLFRAVAAGGAAETNAARTRT